MHFCATQYPGKMCYCMFYKKKHSQMMLYSSQGTVFTPPRVSQMLLLQPRGSAAWKGDGDNINFTSSSRHLCLSICLCLSVCLSVCAALNSWAFAGNPLLQSLSSITVSDARVARAAKQLHIFVHVLWFLCFYLALSIPILCTWFSGLGPTMSCGCHLTDGQYTPAD